jgi:hypothetical protein
VNTLESYDSLYQPSGTFDRILSYPVRVVVFHDRDLDSQISALKIIVITGWYHNNLRMDNLNVSIKFPSIVLRLLLDGELAQFLKVATT